MKNRLLNTPINFPNTLPEEYILKIGKLIRKFSLDELPQLLNIIQGEMNFKIGRAHV